MSVKADLIELKKMEQAAPQYSAGPDLSMLATTEQVIVWVITDCRAAGDDEVHGVELLIRHSNMSPGEVRSAERVLRRLGFIAVADTIRQIAGRRRDDLKPP